MSKNSEVLDLFIEQIDRRERAILREFSEELNKLLKRSSAQNSRDRDLPTREENISAMFKDLCNAIEWYNYDINVINQRMGVQLKPGYNYYQPAEVSLSLSVKPREVSCFNRMDMLQCISKDHPLYIKYQKRLKALDALRDSIRISLTLGSNYKKLFTETLAKMERI